MLSRKMKMMNEIIKREGFISKILKQTEAEFHHYLKCQHQGKNEKMDYFLGNIKDESRQDYIFSEFYTFLTLILKVLQLEDIQSIGSSTEAELVQYVYQTYAVSDTLNLLSTESRSRNFWSGQIAKAEAKKNIQGCCDSDIPGIANLFYLCKLISKKEKSLKCSNYLSNLLANLNSALFAVNAKDEVNVYLSADGTSGLIAHNNFWNAELPVLQRLYFRNIVKKIRLNIHTTEGWKPLELNAKSDWSEIKIFRREVLLNPLSIVAHHHQSLQTKLLKDPTLMECKESKIHVEKPHLDMQKMKVFTSKLMNRAKDNLVCLNKDAAQLVDLDLGNPSNGITFESKRGSKTLEIFKILHSSNRLGKLNEIEIVARYFPFPHHLSKKNREKILKNIQYAHEIYEAICMLNYENYITDESIELILQDPENAHLISQAYIKTMPILPSWSLLPDDFDRILWSNAKAIMVINPRNASMIIYFYRQFLIKAMFLHETEKEFVAVALTMEVVGIYIENFLNICSRMHGFRLVSESDVSRKTECIYLKGGYRLVAWSLLTNENIGLLVRYAKYLPLIDKRMQETPENAIISQEYFSGLFVQYDQQDDSSVVQEDKPITEPKEISAEVTQQKDLIDDIFALVNVDPEKNYMLSFKAKTFQGKAAIKCFYELGRAHLMHSELTEENKKLIIINIRYSYEISRAFEYLNSGLKKLLNDYSIKFIMKYPKYALDIAKAFCVWVKLKCLYDIEHLFDLHPQHIFELMSILSILYNSSLLSKDLKNKLASQEIAECSSDLYSILDACHNRGLIKRSLLTHDRLDIIFKNPKLIPDIKKAIMALKCNAILDDTNLEIVLSDTSNAIQLAEKQVAKLASVHSYSLFSSSSEVQDTNGLKGMLNTFAKRFGI